MYTTFLQSLSQRSMANPSESQMLRLLAVAHTGNLTSLTKLAKEMDNGEGLANTFAKVKDGRGRTVLHAAGAGGQEKLCDYLVKKMKLDVNLKDNKGYTALHHAVADAHIRAIRYLVRAGGDVNLPDGKGCTPLHVAADHGNTEVLGFLISNGASVDSIAESGTPLHRAAANGKKDAVELLLGHHANPNIVVHHFFTPLLLSIVAGSFECLKLLLEAGADPNKGACGVMPLNHAAGMRKAKMVEWLLKFGADPNAGGSSGLTPLEYAALNRDQQIMRMLFPVTARIESYPEWTVNGIANHIDSNAVSGKRAKEGFLQWKEKGKEAFQKKDYCNAIFWYTKAIDVSPFDETLFSNRSLCWARLNDGDQALSDAIACVRLKPNWFKAHYRGGAALKILNNYESAAEAFGKAMYLDPDNKGIEKEFREVMELAVKECREER